ncbi:Uncharacterized protein M6B38_214540 [Iris pallida]|uniref:ENT domain-containing protein n=1 Tax=Iris pallida TaxID=29817 RepID=A0AAX6E1H7_IRIPA|nr:Uncharacterized protein M6B38_214540 [Iris pallida]
MRFKEGSRVEVSKRKKDACDSWAPARIVSKDGRTYTVRYDLLLNGGGKPVEEKAHEKDIRPCPPRAHEEEKWVLGDGVEVFDIHSWRVGKIAKVLGNKLYIVRLCGSVQIKKFHISDLRIRQAWHDNRWIMLGKGNGNEQLHGSSKGVAYLGSESDNVKIEEAHTVCRYEQDKVQKPPSRRTVKKSVAAYGSSLRGGTVVEANKKRKLTSEAHEIQQPTTKTLLSRKVDVSSPLSKDVLRKNCTHPSSIPLVEESTECSVASCSGNGVVEHTNQSSRKLPRAVADSHFGDTSSRCPSESGRVCPSVDIHELELHAYKTTMQALFASGPLSWEQESLLTNLRLSLHISNEEHLHQLRSLLAS